MARLVAVLALSLFLGLDPAPAGAAPAAAAPPVRLSEAARDRWVAALDSFRAGDWSAAAPEFAALAAGPSPLAEYALFFRAESLARLGDAAGAREVAARAAAQAPDGRLEPAALLLAAEQAARAGDEAGAAALFQGFLARHGDHAEAPRVQYALGLSLVAAGRAGEASGVFRTLWLTAPASAYAEDAVRQERLLADRGVAAPPPTPGERADRVERLLAAGRATDAREAAQALVDEGVAPELALRALRVVAEAWRRSGRGDRAAQSVTRALLLAPPEERAPWLLDLARLQQRSAREAALATLRRIVQEHPRSPEAAEALLLEARLQEEASRGREAKAAYGRLAADYPEEEAAGAALWRLGWLGWLAGAHADAAERWERLLVVRGGLRYRDAGAYWLGRAREALGEREAAERHFADLVSAAPRSYYGVLAAGRLARRGTALSASAGRPGVTLPADPREPLRDDARYVKVEALRAVGLPELADGELDALVRRAAGDPPLLYALSAAYLEDSRYHLALRILRRHFLGMVRAAHAALPRTFWEMLYPMAWRSELVRSAARAALEPSLVAAVAREESSFDPQARSSAGARGLMQLMPDTARPLARARGLRFDEGELLDDPAVSLELGSAFLGTLLKEFGDPRLAVAAYNAGPGRVRRWWAARASDDLEVWVEQIPFSETRAFVKRVMLSWDEYRRLYDARP